MARRGDVLHTHILDVAKLVFLEHGYERTTMDAVAAEAGTSKRSLYAHFPTKAALFSGCVDRVHELFEGRLSVPSHYADDPVEAVVRYCARFRQLLAYAPVLRTCRMGVAEAERLPDAAAGLYDTYVGTAARELTTHLVERVGMLADEAPDLAARLLGATALPFWARALFGLEELRDTMPAEAALADDVDLEALRPQVAALLALAGVAQSSGR